jgi:hypothetical protein
MNDNAFAFLWLTGKTVVYCRFYLRLDNGRQLKTYKRDEKTPDAQSCSGFFETQKRRSF